ncbi:hypothetical protein DYY88_06310 [Leptolyngbya iicbica LK]|uniref:Uncharacterized protein n=1 Tax=Leptolyngbya iicbica LK TaxID=2294035 RepID=A0A4Q7EID4_9CYAN|nr:hypothetical protein [Leptolyngbya sp. LK]RZM82818.1 hypothetical protein DYY88_06310 [Leptolyngbya sp. LK]
MSELWRSLPQWLTRQWTVAPTVTESESQWAALPAGITQALTRQLQALPPPVPYTTAIQLATREALQAWQANPETVSNCLVVLTRPVDAIALILKESLQDYLLDYEVRFLLSGYHRPPNALEITGHLQRELVPEQKSEGDQPAMPVTQTDMHASRLQINVIPSLEPCFLRCIQGWQGIEYLQNQVAQDDSCFWVMGCNHWAWAFLDKVCQVGAYLERTMTLPSLSGEDLADWLRPLAEVVLQSAPDLSLTLQIAQDDADFWKTLASVSAGSATTAAYLWLQTLCVEAERLAPDGTLPPDLSCLEITPRKPKLPSLMSLEALDRYLLHALLLHGEMTRSHLALSMGEDERMIRSRVQVLRREGLMRQTGRWLTVHPAHYPKLYSELGNNNFLIGQA